MLRHQILAAAVVVSLLGLGLAVADEVRYYEKDGVTYRETRRIVHRPVSEIEVRQSTETVYREQRAQEVREQIRTCWTPVTEYRCENFWVGRWNPFVEPYLASRLVPRTRWERRTEVVQVPITTSRLVPEIRTVNVPVTVRRMVPEEVITRMAVSDHPPASLSPLTPSPTLAQPQQIGGLARLDNDPPRHGVSTAWRGSANPR